jgi:hypothetical protein
MSVKKVNDKSTQSLQQCDPKLFQIFVSSEEEKDECNLCDMVIPEWGDFDV